MKSTKKDDLTRELLRKTAALTGYSLTDVETVMNNYHKTIAQNIQQSKPVTVHVDYIGRFFFNQAKIDKIVEATEKKKANGGT